MKFTKNYRVINAEDGEFTVAFGAESFASPQEVVTKISDAERRVSIAMSRQEIPEKSDMDLVKEVIGKSFTIQEVITFN